MRRGSLLLPLNWWEDWDDRTSSRADRRPAAKAAGSLRALLGARGADPCDRCVAQARSASPQDSRVTTATSSTMPSTGIDWNSFAPVDLDWRGAVSQSATRPSAAGSSRARGRAGDDERHRLRRRHEAGRQLRERERRSKPPNKDDLKRAYVASTIGGRTGRYLALAWARIPQNTTSASAHVGFEFNQGSTACDGTGLVNAVDRERRRPADRVRLRRRERRPSAETAALEDAREHASRPVRQRLLPAAGSSSRTSPQAGNAEARVNTADAWMRSIRTPRRTTPSQHRSSARQSSI